MVQNKVLQMVKTKRNYLEEWKFKTIESIEHLTKVLVKEETDEREHIEKAIKSHTENLEVMVRIDKAREYLKV